MAKSFDPRHPRHPPPRSQAGARGEEEQRWPQAFDAVMMFKVLVLQTLYNLADEQVEYQIRDRLSFMRFLSGCP